jgi:transposase
MASDRLEEEQLTTELDALSADEQREHPQVDPLATGSSLLRGRARRRGAPSAAGEELLAVTFAHDEDGVSALCAALTRFEVEVVAIERPDGLLVDRLLEAGVPVLALHPNQVKAARDRFRASGGKSDRFDCFVLCELARTDRHRFRLLSQIQMRRRRCGP